MISQLKQIYTNSFLLFLIVLLPSIAISQTGHNDCTFNAFDNGRYAGKKGTNGKVVNAIIQPNNRTILVGDFTTYNLKSYNRIVRLNPDGNPDATFRPGEAANDKITCIALQADGKMIVGGDFTEYNGKPLGYIARLNTAGKNDHTFKTGTGANAVISNVLIQRDGKIIVAGNFTDFNGTSAKGLIRLTKSGSVDPTFNIIDTLFNIKKMVIQPDGKIVLSYMYNYFQGLIRLNENGSIDNTYNVDNNLLNNPFIPLLEAMDIQADGKIIIATRYTRTNHRNSKLYRLTSTGDIDTTFKYNSLGEKRVHVTSIVIQKNKEIIITGNAGSLTNTDSVSYIAKLTENGIIASDFSNSTLMENQGIIYDACVDANGEIIIHGLFSHIQGISANNIAKLNTDGSFDVAYNKVSGANGKIKTTAVQTDGKTIIGGDFLSYNLVPRSHIARINNDGNLDHTFVVGSGTNGSINSVCIQSDERIIIAGNFSEYNGFATNNIARLNADGSLDDNFKLDSKVNGIINLVMVQSDGKIIISGDFTYSNGVAAQPIYRLTENGSIDSDFYPLQNEIVSSITSYSFQPNGKIILNGIFYIDNNKKNVVRLNTDGTLDITFNCMASPALTTVFQADGKIIIGGKYQAFKQMYYGYVDRFNEDGSKDTTFQKAILTGAAENTNDVRTITIHENGEILIGGHFSYCNEMSMSNVSDLDENGTVDSNFYSHASGDVYSTALLPDGKVIIAGDFASYNNIPRNNIARIAFARERATSREEVSTPLISNIETSKELTILVYPNPAATNLAIDNLPIGSTLTIRNALGKLVYATIVTDQKNKLEVSSYANGIYFVTNEFNGSTSNIKFVVNK